MSDFLRTTNAFAQHLSSLGWIITSVVRESDADHARGLAVDAVLQTPSDLTEEIVRAISSAMTGHWHAVIEPGHVHFFHTPGLSAPEYHIIYDVHLGI